RAPGILVQFVAIERAGSDRPPLLHPLKSTGECCFLLRGQHALMGYRYEPSDRLAPAGDDVFLTRLNLTNAAGEALVGFAQADHLAHSSPPGRPRSRSAAAASRLIVFTEIVCSAQPCYI